MFIKFSRSTQKDFKLGRGSCEPFPLLFQIQHNELNLTKIRLVKKQDTAPKAGSVQIKSIKGTKLSHTA